MHHLKLILRSERLAICRLKPEGPIPAWAESAGFYSITRSADELSIVCVEAGVPADIRHEAGWRAFQVQGQLPFEATGILAALGAPLAVAGIPIFAISTYDTDYVLVRDDDAGRAADVLAESGHSVELQQDSGRSRNKGI